MVLDTLVLVGWWWRIDFLKRVGEGLISMNPLTASCCICAGISLVMQLRGPVPLARVLAGMITAIGALKLGAYRFGWGFPLDGLMFRMELPLNEPVLMMPVMDGQEMIGAFAKSTPPRKSSPPAASAPIRIPRRPRGTASAISCPSPTPPKPF